MAGLMSYLAGPGRANEHTHPMIVAGDDRVTFAVEPGREMTSTDAFEVAYILDQPRRAYGASIQVPVREWDEQEQRHVKVGEKDGHVWHCSLAIRHDDRSVSKEEWGRIAHRFVEEMGFIDPDGAKSSRWAAIHHGVSKNGNDHIHIAVQMVREDGTRASEHNDRYRAQKAARVIEREFGLSAVEGRGAGKGLGSHAPAEAARAARAGHSLPVPVQLRQTMRSALSSADSPLGYLHALQDAGVTIAPSFQKGSRNAVRGYKVALSGQAYRTREGRHVFASPSKLDPSLSWPKVCQRFGGKGREEAERYLASLHGTARASGSVPRHHRPIHPVNVERLMSGKRGTGPDTLANIYARLAVEMEGDKDGPLGRLSERMARAQTAPGSAAWRVRQTARFAKGDGRGTLALVRQANRLSRVMVSQHITRSRPQLGRDMTALLRAVESMHKIVGDSAETHRPAVRAGRQERGYEHGRG